MKDFRVLLFYPNEPLAGIVPSNLAILSACLKQAGYTVKLFDCTIYRSLHDVIQDQLRSKLGQVKKTNIDEYVHLKETNIYDDFVKIVEEYKPNLIGITLVDSTIKFALSFLERIKHLKIPVVTGGVGTTFQYEKILKTKLVDYACIGEGEEAIVELCDKLYKKEYTRSIRNIYTLDHNGDIITNLLRPLVNLDDLPMPDYTIYDDMRFYRPFLGQVLRTVPTDIDRGCLYGCTYCAAPSLRKTFRENDCGNYYRTKSLDKIFDEMKYLIKQFNLNFVWISAETILSLKDEKFKEFAKRYKEEINLPFWCQSRLDTFTDENTKILADIGCKNISVGLEHGSEIFRRKILNKHISNERVIESIKLLAKYKIYPSINNIIGFPDETRENIFETIDLNRQISEILQGQHNTNAFIFMPFSGTKLRQMCLEKGYIKENDELSFSLFDESMLDMPNLSKEEIKGLERTFILYVLLPKIYWDGIKIAEKDNEEGNKKFNELLKLIKK